MAAVRHENGDGVRTRRAARTGVAGLGGADVAAGAVYVAARVAAMLVDFVGCDLMARAWAAVAAAEEMRAAALAGAVSEAAEIADAPDSAVGYKRMIWAAER